MKTLGAEMGYPVGVLITVVIKINGRTVSADFGKPKTFQLVYRFTIYATVAFYKEDRSFSIFNMLMALQK